MTPMARDDYCVGVPENVTAKLVLNSMDPKYGGTAPIKKKTYHAVKSECDGRPYRIECPLPPYGCLVFELD